MPVHRVLLVDDTRDVRRMLRAGIETLGQDVKVMDVPSGEEAILVISRQPFDLIIVDIRLPGISGLELIERAQVRNPEMKIILVTGLTDSRTRREIEQLHPDAYFFKPIDLRDFLAAVERCLGMVPISTAPAADTINQPVAAEQAAPPGTESPRHVKDHGGVEEAANAAEGLSPRLAGLRQELEGLCAALVHENGEVMAQAGDLPSDASDPAFISSLMTTFSAATKVSYLLGAYLPDDWLCFAGKTYDILLTHVGQSIGLLVITEACGWTEERLGKFLRHVRGAAKDLSATLAEWGVALSAQVEGQGNAVVVPAQEEAEEEALDLDAIFSKAQRNKLKRQDLDAFWAPATQEGEEQMTRADVISYKQARQLGLAPEEN